jgi:hypothetical protein
MGGRGPAYVALSQSAYTDEKGNEIFLMFKEIQMGSFAK